MIVAARKIGRCANGSERGKGFVYHAINDGLALCGTEPGRQSAGWQSEPEPVERVNCPRCVKKLASVNCAKCGGTGWLHGAQEWTPGRMSKGTPYKSVRCGCARANNET